ncbi:MAG TPA: NADH-quinone oxidoreductase subunit NuoF, partial [Candidatus Binataceae bacterium]|nr:NADH-quinone oxidoreductase subunit NuoF [Candidatus Binataceae bacterium]
SGTRAPALSGVFARPAIAMSLSAATQEKIREEISYYPHPRGALLSALHFALAEKGDLTPETFAEVGEFFGMRAGEVAEVASFYSLFKLPRAQAVFQVCTGLPCCLRGARDVVSDLERRLRIKSGTADADGRFGLAEVECLGSCATAPVIQVNRNPYLENVTPEFLATIVESPAKAVDARHAPDFISSIPEGVEGYLLPPDGKKWLTLEDYRRNGGYEAIKKAGEMAPKDIAALVKDAGLRGRGGAGFATGLKWTFMPPPDGGPRYLAVNADESEPGTFKDRQIMERNPHRFIEGVMISGRAIEATAAFIYIRGEYVKAYGLVRSAIAEAYAAGILGANALGFGRRFDIHIQPGAGAYICGEESGMLESMEGKKGQPRKRPPFPATRGLWSRPTTVDNCETVSQVPTIIMKGADWFKAEGAKNSSGHTLFGISGHVKRPGIYELRLGVKMRDLIFKYGGGLLEEGRTVKAVIPGGISMPILRGDQIDVAVDHESLRTVNSLLGTAGVIVMDDRTCMVRVALTAARFFDHESCGQCTQCREGTGWIYHTLERIEHGHGVPGDLERLADCCNYMDGKCICALADGASWSARAFFTQFRGDFEAHIAAHGCPFPESFKV